MQPDWRFFTDRDLGKQVPSILRDEGIDVCAYSEHFGEQPLPDLEWLADVGARNWVVLTHDRRITKNRLERQAVYQHGVRLFVLRGNLTAQGLSDLFVDALPKVRRLLKNNEAPFMARIWRQESRRARRKRAMVEPTRLAEELEEEFGSLPGRS